MDFSPPPDGAGEGLGSTGGSDSERPTHAEIAAAVAAIKASRHFSGSERLRAFLDHIVGLTLEGKGGQIKEFSIAVDVFNRPDSFDPRVDSIVRVQASRLRAQLAAFYKKPPPGTTVLIELPSGGYQPTFSRFTPAAPPAGELQRVTPDEAGEPPIPAVARSAPATSRWSEIATRRPWLMPALLGAATLALIAVLAVTLSNSRPAPESATRDFAYRRTDGPVIFVARYQLISGPDYASALRDGLQFDLIDSLSRFPELNVLGIDTVYGSSAEPARANPHGADFIVTGSIQATDSTIRVTSQLVLADDNRVVWSEAYEGTLKDAASVLEVQSKIAGDVAGQLGQPHGVIQERLKEELTENRALSMDDYLCVLDSYEYSRTKSAAKHAEVRACLEEVTRHSPRYAPAWAKLSWMYGDEDRYGFNPRTDGAPAVERALDAANRAIAANSSSGMAHQYLAIAQFRAGDVEGFRKSIETALRLNPNNAEILADAAQMLILLDGSGQAPQSVERARELGERAIALNPGHPPWYHQPLSIYHVMKGNKVEALETARAGAPDGAPMASYLLAAALRLNGRQDEADAVLKEFEQRTGDPITSPARRAQIKASTRLPKEVADLIFRD
jgi:adenylate cyclase